MRSKNNWNDRTPSLVRRLWCLRLRLVGSDRGDFAHDVLSELHEDISFEVFQLGWFSLIRDRRSSIDYASADPWNNVSIEIISYSDLTSANGEDEPLRLLGG
jgi:hypothetical protein